MSPRSAAIASTNQVFPSNTSPAKQAPNAPTVSGILVL